MPQLEYYADLLPNWEQMPGVKPVINNYVPGVPVTPGTLRVRILIDLPPNPIKVDKTIEASVRIAP